MRGKGGRKAKPYPDIKISFRQRQQTGAISAPLTVSLWPHIAKGERCMHQTLEHEIRPTRLICDNSRDPVRIYKEKTAVEILRIFRRCVIHTIIYNAFQMARL